MITDHRVQVPPTEQQHRYPPAASSSPARQSMPFNTDATPSASDNDLISYIVHTDTNGVSDLRLQVSQEASSSKQPLHPVYFRERALTERHEIVDSIIDANTGATSWTIHRPTRGWYLYLRSPAMPPGTAISFRSDSGDNYDPTATPLSFSLNTRVRMHALEFCRARISTSSDSLRHQGDDIAAATTSRESNGTCHGVTVRLEEDVGAQRNEVQDVAVAVTGRQDRKSSSGGHTRRRSGATGSATNLLDSRQPSKRASSTIAKSPRIPETDDEPATPASQPRNHLPPSRLAIPAASTPSASLPQSPSGDRPYSPSLASTPSLPASPLAPHVSTFLLTDGQGPNSKATTQSWVRWACSILPAEIRPSLSLDADKSFSLHWLNPPATTQQGTTAKSVEVVRFQDQSGRWMWNSHTRGRLTLQTSAMQAVGLPKEFWISAALAYIQFLEDKDAYEAARDA